MTKKLQEVNWAKVAGMLLLLGVASYGMFWAYSKLREEIRFELGGTEFYNKKLNNDF